MHLTAFYLLVCHLSFLPFAIYEMILSIEKKCCSVRTVLYGALEFYDLFCQSDAVCLPNEVLI